MTILVKYEDGSIATAEVRPDMTPLEILSDEYLTGLGKIVDWERVEDSCPHYNLIEAEKAAKMDDFIIEGYVTVSTVNRISYSIEDSKRILKLAKLLDIGFFDAADRLGIKPQCERVIDYDCEDQLEIYSAKEIR